MTRGKNLGLGVCLVLASTVVTACAGRSKNKGSQMPRQDQGPEWLHLAKESIAQRLDRDPHDPVAQREQVLVDVFFDYPKPHSPSAESKARLLELSQKHKDPVAGYGLWLYARESYDDAQLWPALQAMLGASAQSSAVDERYREQNWPLRVALEEVANWLEDRPYEDANLASYQQQVQRSANAMSLGARRELLSLGGKVARIRGTNYGEFYAAQGCVKDWEVGPVQGVLGDLSLSHADMSKPFEPEGRASVFPLTCAMRVWNPEPTAGYRRLQTQLEVGAHGAVLELRSGNQERVFWDGVEIWRNDRLDRYPAGMAELYIPAQAGTHRLEVALAVPGERSWFSVRATDIYGNPLKASAEDVLSRVGISTQVSAGTPSKAPGSRSGAQKAGANTSNLQFYDRLDDPYTSCQERLLPKDSEVPKLYEALVAHCALSAAMYTGDLDRAYRYAQQLAQFQGFALGQVALADFTRSRADMHRANSKALAFRFVQAGAGMDPSLTRARAGEMQAKMRRGEEAQVMKSLRHGALEGSNTVQARLFEVSNYLSAGDELRAEQALAKAEAMAPQHCKVMRARFSRARSIDNMAAQARLLESLQQCPGGREMAANWYSDHGDYKNAKFLYDRLQAERPDDIALMSRRAQLAEVQGDWATARVLWQAQNKLAPYRDHPRIRLSDIAMAHPKEGQASGKKQLQAAIDLRPHDPELRFLGSRMGIDDPLLKERIDGMAIIEKQRKNKNRKVSIFNEQQSARYLLDRDVVEVYPDGSQRHLVHQIIQVLDKEAIDQFGEISLPNGAQLLTLRSVKDNGDIVDPESIAGKESYSLRGLSPGDYVEQEWIMPAGGAGISPGRVDLGGFRFQSTQAPFLRSELIVVHPRDMELSFESKNKAPEGKKSTSGDWTRWTFSAKDMPRLQPEPFAQDYQDILPQIRGFANLSTREWLAGIVQDVRWARRRGPALRDKVQALVAGKNDPKQMLAAIWAFVRDDIESQGNLSVPADRSYDEQKGNKATLLAAMLEEAGIPTQTLIVRSRFAPRLDSSGHPQFESYDAVVLRIDAEPGRPQYLVPDLDKAALGYLPPWLEGADAYVLPLGLQDNLDKPQRVQVPAGDIRHRDRRLYTLKLKIDAEGNANIQGTIRLHGLDAAQWRRLWENVAPEQREELVLQIEVARLFPGAALQLESFSLSPLEDPDQALDINFRAVGRNLARPGGSGAGGLVVPSAPLSLNPGMRYAALPERKLDLLIPYAPEQSGHVDVELAAGQFLPTLQNVSLDSEFGEYKRRVEYKGNHMSIDLHSTLRSGIIAVDDYAKFVEFVQKIRNAEREPLRAEGSSVAAAR